MIVHLFDSGKGDRRAFRHSIWSQSTPVGVNPKILSSSHVPIGL